MTYLEDIGEPRPFLAAILDIALGLSDEQQLRLADMLSGIAADIRKGEDKRGKDIAIWVAR